MENRNKVFVDAGVLLLCTFADIDIEKHQRAIAKLAEMESTGTELCTSVGCLCEFFTMSTSSEYVNKPLGSEEGEKQLRFFADSLKLLPMNREIHEIALPYISANGITGANLHHALNVASMISFGISSLLTTEPAQYQIFRSVKTIGV